MNTLLLRRYISLGLLVVLILVFSVFSPYFFTVNNMTNILREASYIGIIAVGLSLVIITAGIDLSVGSIVGFSAMVCADLMRYTTVPTFLVILIGVLTGIAAGVFNGFIIAKFKLPDFIVTLASMGIFRGLTLIASDNNFQSSSDTVIQNETYTWLGGNIGPISFVVIVFAIVAFLGHVLLRWSRFGTSVYSVGSNPQSAAFSGISQQKVKLLVYMLVGAASAITGIMLSARMMTATPELGTGMEFDVITAVVVGGCSLFGGRGDIIGVIIGTFFMAVLDNGLYQFNISSSTQPIIKGVVVVLAIIFDTWFLSKSKKLIVSDLKLSKRLLLQRGEKPHEP